MKNNLFDKTKKVHFIGIGGIGISAIAKMFLLEGKKVSGSDMSDSKIIEELKNSGAEIKIGHSEKNLSDNIDLVVYTIAITDENTELQEAKKKNIKCITYPQALNEISKEKYTIAVSGTHGKTTTTAMIAKIMIDAGLDPTVIVGSLLKDTKSNFVAGKSKYLVVESCEYRKSFLNIEPDIAVVTNIDNDHLDFYKDIFDIQNAFGEFTEKVPENGYIICDNEDKLVTDAIRNSKAKIVFSNQFSSDFKLKIPGEHNRKNAEKALTVAHLLEIDKKKAIKSLEEFSGTWRRFEFKGETSCGALVYDDYGHHPTEIKATLKGAREFFSAKGGSAYGGVDKKIIVVFQPHLFSRTKLLLNDFAKSFNDADEVLLAPIYPAREAFDPTISSEILADKIRISMCHSRVGGNPVFSFSSFSEIGNYIKENLKEGDVLITVGAGDVYKIGEKLVSSI
jgi:UDP-N-acetylmuramate--alanine ligase